MAKPLIVWDHDGAAPEADGEVWHWRSYGDPSSSVPAHLEAHAERLKARYLAFIHELGEQRVAGKRVVEQLDLGDGFSFWWMSLLAEKSPFKSPRIYECLRVMALEEMLLARKPAALLFHSCDAEVAAAIRELCRNMSIDFSWKRLPLPREGRLRRCYRRLPHPLQGLVSLRHLALRWPLTRLKKPQWFSGEGAVLMCSYFIHLDPEACANGEFYSRQWEVLPGRLHQEHKRTNWIHQFLFSSIVPDTRTGLDWLARINLRPSRNGQHYFLESGATWGIVLRALRKWIGLIGVSWRLKRIRSAFQPAGSSASLWPLLKDDWRTSLRGTVALANCLWLELFDVALRDMPPQGMGLYLCENQGWERAFLRAWRRHGHGTVIGVPHSTVPFWHLYYFDDPRSLNSSGRCRMPLPDYLAINGKPALKAFLEQGYPPEKLVEVEALRYLSLLKVRTGADGDAIGPRAEPSAAPRTKILILGELAPSSMHTLLTLLQEIVGELPQQFELTLKPHPGHAIDLAAYPALRAGETREPLDRILPGYDIALAANSTSAAVDAYAAGLPVIVWLDGSVLNLSPLRGVPDARFAGTREELTQALLTARSRIPGSRSALDLFFLDPELPRWRRLLRC